MKAHLAAMALTACHLMTALTPAAAQTDTCADTCADTLATANPYKFHPAQLALPAVAIGFGIVGLESDWLKSNNADTREELQENVGHRLRLDDFTQYAPLAATYGLNLVGIKGLHNYGDLTLIAGTSYALMSAVVFTLKSTTRVERPDATGWNSFPSGHTATAFLGAEILRKEYWDVSPWIGVAGYAVAAGTGFFRMFNNRHWLTDVVAGAGIGILSAEAGYWLYPVVARHLFPRLYEKNIYIAPQVSPYVSVQDNGAGASVAKGMGFGIGCVIRF